MGLSPAQKQPIIADNRINDADTGSSEVQVALLTKRINDLEPHFKANRKDHHSRRGLLMMVGKRDRLLRYVAKNDIQKYRALIAKLGIRDKLKRGGV